MVRRIFNDPDNGISWSTDTINSLNPPAKPVGVKTNVGYFHRAPGTKNGSCQHCVLQGAVVLALAMNDMGAVPAWTLRCRNQHIASQSDVSFTDGVSATVAMAWLLQENEHNGADYAIRTNKAIHLHNMGTVLRWPTLTFNAQSQAGKVDNAAIPVIDLHHLRAQLYEPKLKPVAAITTADIIARGSNSIRPANDRSGEVHRLQQEVARLQGERDFQQGEATSLQTTRRCLRWSNGD